MCCPISLQPFNDPVIMLDGHTYDRGSIAQAVQRNGGRPLTRSLLHGAALPYGRGGYWGTRQMPRNECWQWSFGRCPLTREPLRVPMFYTVGRTVYEHEAFVARIRVECDTAANEFWRQSPFARRIRRGSGDARAFLVPHRTLASLLGLRIPRDVARPWRSRSRPLGPRFRTSQRRLPRHAYARWP